MPDLERRSVQLHTYGAVSGPHRSAWAGKTDQRVVVIWDGAPWHRAKLLHEKAQSLNIELIQLPGYSPDLNPIEGLWKWMREEVTQHVCHNA